MKANENSDSVTEVHVTGFNMPFWSLVGFMVKVAIASIPALIIASLLIWIPVLMLTGTFATLIP